MNRYFVYLAYDGTNYCGWQLQPKGVSVQGCVEASLSLLSGEKVRVTGAGRTDAGVHARCMVAHFDAPGKLIPYLTDCGRLNRILPNDIAVYDIFRVGEEAHARYDAISRTYKYYLSGRKDPFTRAYTYFYPVTLLNRVAMNEAAHLLLDYEDFTSFSKLYSGARTNRCCVTVAEWDESYTFTISANRFLRNMVRAIVGTLLAVGRGKLSPNDFRRIIERRDRSAAGTSAPAQGLFLDQITYDLCKIQTNKFPQSFS
ncbi:MAG: tRNA pseudouridine(38-40) synthase TruA [Tannerellaceae bacterium]|jgi:tRNA pseudouridine38-40 synthase|nr:tRNA pseudouridine(38-40) synthase TruA [Tannerellaceae bacterium]